MAGKNKILIVSDDSSLVERLTAELLNRGYLLCTAKPDVIQTVFDEVPHLIIIDASYGDEEGKKIAADVKDDMVVKYIPIILLVDGESDVRLGKVVDFCLRRSEKAEKVARLVEETLAKNYNELDLNPLTHLPGVRSSVSCIEHAIQSKKPFSICCVDLSDLSAFNGSYGVGRGDEVIVRLAKIAGSALKREGAADDFLGHLGGDDFIIVTHSDRAVPVSEAVIRDFDAAVGGYYDVEDRRKGYIVQPSHEGVSTRYPLMGLSIAIVHCNPRGPGSMVEFSRIAGELKKTMKGQKGSCYVKYRQSAKDQSHRGGKNGPSLKVCFPTRKSVRVAGLETGNTQKERVVTGILQERKIKTLYQPIVDLKTKTVVGYEALTRAVPERLFPDITQLFVDARECGLVKDLDKLCIDTALKSGQSIAPGRKLFMNLNHETLIDEALMRDIFSGRGKIAPKDIVIEVTEQSILRSFDKVREALAELRDQGASVAIDDVGGGAVSLRDVAILKPDYIKFDRSLIRQIDTSVTKQQIVLSLKIFAAGIQAVTTAEGIETKEEYEVALACGILLGQGYYFAKPGEPFPDLII